MYEMPVKGEIKTLACKEGSSGIFTGSIEGLYQGYRFGSTTPDEREYVLEAPNGTIALRLRQAIVTPLPPRPQVHPFAGGKDPFENAPPPGAQGHGGPPPGVSAAGGPPPGAAAGPGGGPGAPPPGFDPFRRIHYMEVKLQVDPEKSTGIFAGATGEMEVMPPNYQMAGYLEINTGDGDLRMNFMEAGARGVLNADLQVDGEHSTGIYRNSRGDLKFSLTTTPPNFGRGPYSGTIWLEHEPPKR